MFPGDSLIRKIKFFNKYPGTISTRELSNLLECMQYAKKRRFWDVISYINQNRNIILYPPFIKIQILVSCFSVCLHNNIHINFILHVHTNYSIIVYGPPFFFFCEFIWIYSHTSNPRNFFYRIIYIILYDGYFELKRQKLRWHIVYSVPVVAPNTTYTSCRYHTLFITIATHTTYNLSLCQKVIYYA